MHSGVTPSMQGHLGVENIGTFGDSSRAFSRSFVPKKNREVESPPPAP